MSTVYTNGRIYTADPHAPFAEAIVIDGKRVAFVGGATEATAIAGPDATAVDLAGRMLMPGIHDSHIHLLFGGLKFLYEDRVSVGAGGEQIVQELLELHSPHASSTHSHDEFPWIVGGDVSPPADGTERLTRKHLDDAFPDTPVYLYDYSIHHGVANSKALDAAGITEDAEDMPGGMFLRDEERRLTGELIEKAGWSVRQAIPPRTQEVYRNAMKWAIDNCLKYGITSVQEASASRPELEALRALEQEGELKLRVDAHLVWRNQGFGMGTDEELDALLDDAPAWASEHVDTNFVKVWLDGAPMPPVSTVAGLREDGSVDTDWLLVQEDELLDMLRRFDAAGRTVKIHCAAEGATRTALDAIERLRAENPDGTMHELAHAAFVTDSDMVRLAPLNVTAEMSPAVWHLDAFGMAHKFAFRSMLDHGVRMVLGSDWINTPDPNLFPAIQGTVQHATSPIDLHSALAAVTRVPAESRGKLGDRGTLAAGKVADYLVLDRDLFAVPVDEIGATVVLQTYIDGELVHAHDGG